ncbi:UNVERIFIED_ORG: hypothetical protein BDU10_5055 [Burkholderia sp. CF145]
MSTLASVRGRAVSGSAAGLVGFLLVSGLVFLRLRWHPRYAFVLHASPLCGAAPTFLCRRKEK